MSTLFVNACMRGNNSRTLELCRRHLAHIDTEIVEIDLGTLDLKPLNGAAVEYRTERQERQDWDDPIFDLARQFAAAEDIVVGAPFWDLSLPAALKTYVEHVSVAGITFDYTEDCHYRGLCRAGMITYITTSGGYIVETNFGVNAGYDYIASIARMFGIPKTRMAIAEGLDIWGVDVETELDKARAQIDAWWK